VAEGEHQALDADYIRAAVDEALPLIAECHDLQRRPDLRGVLTVHFRIIGEPDIGGVIDEIELVAEGGAIEAPILQECVRETMLSHEFPAPDDGGDVTVEYPFHFVDEGADVSAAD